MSLFLPQLIDDLMGRVPRSNLTKFSGVTDVQVAQFIQMANHAEKFQFGKLPLERTDRGSELPVPTPVEEEAWGQGLIPMPAPAVWFEFTINESPSGLLIFGDPGSIHVQRVDYFAQKRDGMFTGFWSKEAGNGKYAFVCNQEQAKMIPRAEKFCHFAADHALAVYLMLMLSSLTTEIAQAPPTPEKLNRARIKRGDCPLPDHRIVTLVPERFTRGAGTGTHASPRLHWRRSHKRHYDHQVPSAKFIEGEGWVTIIARQLVGVAELGTVTHEYRVKPH